jgi:D-sedoheptulose 7-phosphate isomerase
VNRVEEIYERGREPGAFAEGYLAYVGELLRTLDSDAVAAFIAAVIGARDRGARIFFIGNGGSAATATHFANDLAVSTRSQGLPFRAVSLTDNGAIITSIANDIGYDAVFTEQLRTHLEPDDVVVAISASGNSRNVVGALEFAAERGATTVALTGFSGGRLREIAQISVHVETAHGEYGPVEDVHMVLDHLIAAYLIELCRAERPADSGALTR